MILKSFIHERRVGRKKAGRSPENERLACTWCRRLSGADGHARCAGLFLPSLNVHADHEEPQAQREFRQAGGHLDVRDQVSCKSWRKKVCETIGQLAQSS